LEFWRNFGEAPVATAVVVDFEDEGGRSGGMRVGTGDAKLEDGRTGVSEGERRSPSVGSADLSPAGKRVTSGEDELCNGLLGISI